MQSRRAAREAIIGLVYERGFHDPAETPEEIFRLAAEEREIGDDPYITACFFGICGHLDEIDKKINEYAEGWSTERISAVTLAILRLAVYELLYAKERLPYSIAINEAVELAKAYAEDGAAPFLNGILNTLAKANGCEA
ncbi:MAG: transcription antitermination factor NusB [Clostridia bacterium]|nr:transcription antitermination factor NusB [Clostridia bacterium]